MPKLTKQLKVSLFAEELAMVAQIQAAHRPFRLPKGAIIRLLLTIGFKTVQANPELIAQPPVIAEENRQDKINE